jgi:hypothetical protein
VNSVQKVIGTTGIIAFWGTMVILAFVLEESVFLRLVEVAACFSCGVVHLWEFNLDRP